MAIPSLALLTQSVVSEFLTVVGPFSNGGVTASYVIRLIQIGLPPFLDRCSYERDEHDPNDQNDSKDSRN